MERVVRRHGAAPGARSMVSGDIWGCGDGELLMISPKNVGGFRGKKYWLVDCQNDNFEKKMLEYLNGENDRQPSEFGGSHSLFSDKAKFVSDMKHYETIEWRGLGGLSICLNFT